MNSKHIVDLIKDVVNPEEVWADLGSGSGAFTLALRELGGPDIKIYSIDKNKSALEKQEKAFQEQYPGSNVNFIVQNFTRDFDLPELDAILMANSMHFIKDQKTFLQRIKKFLKPSGKLLIIEYDIDSGNFFVPYPLSFNNLKTALMEAGFSTPQLISTAPSRYHGQMYSALTHLKTEGE